MIHFLKSRGRRHQSLSKIDQVNAWDGSLPDTPSELDPAAGALTDEEAAEIQFAFQQQVDDATLLAQLLNDGGDGELSMIQLLMPTLSSGDAGFDRDPLDLSQIQPLSLDADLPELVMPEPAIDLDLMQPEVTVASIDGLVDLQLPTSMEDASTELVVIVAAVDEVPSVAAEAAAQSTSSESVEPELLESESVEPELMATASVESPSLESELIEPELIEPSALADLTLSNVELAVDADALDTDALDADTLNDVADLADLELPAADVATTDMAIANSDFAAGALEFEPIESIGDVESIADVAVDSDAASESGIDPADIDPADTEIADPTAIDWSPANWAIETVDQDDATSELALSSAPLSYFQYYLDENANSDTDAAPAPYVTPWHQPSMPSGLIGAGVLGATLVSGFVIADTVKTQPTLTAKKPTPAAPLQALSARDQVAAKVSPKAAPPESMKPEMTLPKPKTSLGAQDSLSPIATLGPTPLGFAATLPQGGSGSIANTTVGNAPVAMGAVAAKTTGTATTGIEPTATGTAGTGATTPLTDLPPVPQKVRLAPVANPEGLESPPARSADSMGDRIPVGEGTTLLPPGTPLMPPEATYASSADPVSPSQPVEATAPTGKAADLVTTPATNSAIVESVTPAPETLAPVTPAPATAAAPMPSEGVVVPTLEAAAPAGEPIAAVPSETFSEVPSGTLSEPTSQPVLERVFDRPTRAPSVASPAPEASASSVIPESAPAAASSAPVAQPISDRFAAPVTAQLLTAQASDRPVLQATNLDERQGRILTAAEAEAIQSSYSSTEYQLQRLALAQYQAAYQRLSQTTVTTDLPMFGFIDYQRKLVILPLNSLTAMDAVVNQRQARLARLMVEL